MTSALAFIEDPLRAAPELRGTYDEHVAFHGETLPHVLMGDVTRFVIGKATASGDPRVLERILGALEGAIAAGAQDVRDLVYASFIENLIGEDFAIRALEPMMGPNLRAALDTIRSS